MMFLFALGFQLPSEKVVLVGFRGINTSLGGIWSPKVGVKG